MTSEDLARAYIRKARARLGALAHLRDAGDHSDVVREAQELVELALKAMLRAIGIEPPRLHDVGPLLVEYQSRFRIDLHANLGRAPRCQAGCARTVSAPFTVM